MSVRYLPIGELARITSGKTPPRDVERYWGGKVPWISPKDMKSDYLSGSLETVTSDAVADRCVEVLPANAVLVVVRGMILAHTLPVSLTTVPATINQDIKALLATETVEPDFLHWMLTASAGDLLRATTVAGHGTRRLTTDILLGWKIPVPNLSEQRRIVARIREAMERVEEIERLDAERRAWVAELPIAYVTEKIAAAREASESRTIGEIVANVPGSMSSGPFGSQLLHSEFVPEGHLVIGIANVQEHRFDPTRKWMIDDKKLQSMQRFRVKAGDVLVTVMGTVGRCCVVPVDIGTAVTSKHVYRIRLPSGDLLPEYLSAILNFDRVTRSSLLGRAIGGVMPGLNSTKLRELRVPVVTLETQRRIVEDLARLLDARTLLREGLGEDCGKLRAAILRQAFSGNL